VFSVSRIIFVVLVILSYILGMATVKYELYPYQKIVALKHLLQGDESLVVPPSYFDQTHYKHRKSLFDESAYVDVDIVFVGDSITEHAEWHELITDKRIANRGISGDRTTGVMNRLDSVIATSADKAFLMLGVNDLLAGDRVDAVLSRYYGIVEQLKDAGMEVIIQSTLYGGPRYPELNEKIEMLNINLKRYAYQKDGVSYVDLNALLAPSRELKREFSEDEIHLNSSGYRKWVSAIARLL
jgi:lysophospholipase L1-like esterase